MVVRALMLPLMFAAAPLAAQCRLCAPGNESVPSRQQRPLNIDVTASLDLGRAAAGGTGGSIALDERTGTRRVDGLADLGGFAIKGQVRLTGEPSARVRVTLPSSVRLRAPDGAMAEAVDLRTDLSPMPVLDPSGQLTFSFGGRLVVSGGASGDFRGRIPISADYE
jgi:hypothetical protein